MSTLFAPPDIELAFVACLAVDDDVWVATRYPATDPPGGVIRVSATGGARPSGLVALEQTVLIECWHELEGEAARLARRAWARLHAASGQEWAGVDLIHVSSTSPNSNPDVNRSSLSRVQFISSAQTRIALVDM